jgi:hypothetical protein
MHPSPFSLPMLAPLLATVLAFLPPVAALRSRYPFWREPAGQVAACWLVMALVGLAQLLWFASGHSLARVPSTAFVTAVFPLMLVPPSLAWIGPAARRWRWPVCAAWLVVWMLAVVKIPDPRAFHALVSPVMALGMAVLSAVALAACVRRTTVADLRADCFWILVGHVVYFAASGFRGPLIEALVRRHWDSAVAVANGILLLYCAVYVVVARGMLLRASVSRKLPASTSIAEAA